MKGLVFLGDKKTEFRDFPKPEPGPAEVLIELKSSGLCGSDLRAYRLASSQVTEESRKIIRGHEPVGVVAKLGPCARGVKVGDRVMVHHYTGCGQCKYCRAGWTQFCLKGAVTHGYGTHGGHGEFMVCSDYSCVPLPDSMTFEEGTCCACGTGTAYHALKRLAVSGMDTLAIFGQGPVGLSATMLAKVMGARVIAIDVVPERLNLAKQFGAVTVDAAKADAVTVINEMTNGEGADATMDCTGMERPRVDTLRSARLWGRAAFIGEKGTATFDITEHIIGKQITIYGSRTFSTLGLAEVANFVVSHEVPLKDLITHTFPFAQADEAYRVFESGKTGKVALVMS